MYMIALRLVQIKCPTRSLMLDSNEVPLAVVQFTYLLADHCEMTWAKLDLSRSMTEVDVDESTLGGSSEQRDTSATQAAREDAGEAKASETAAAQLPESASNKKRKKVDCNAVLVELKGKLAVSGSSIHEETFLTVVGFDAATWLSICASALWVCL